AEPGVGDRSPAARKSNRECEGNPPPRGRVARRGEERRGRAGDPGARRERDGAPVRHPLRRIRNRAQVSPSGGRAISARALARHARKLDARGGGEDPHRDGERRDPRSRGRRLHRYAVDERWIVPHFEKMAYDNSELLRAYLDGYAALGYPLFKQVAQGIVSWVLEVLSDRDKG